MENHGYTTHEYDSTNIVGHKCRTYQLRDNGKVIYTLDHEYDEDGSLDPQGYKHFMMRVDQYMEKRRD